MNRHLLPALRMCLGFWRGILATALWLGFAASLLQWGERLPAAAGLVLWLLLLAAGVLFSLPLGARLFGPALPGELVRATRNSRCFSLRGAFSIFLLLVLFLLYLSWFDRRMSLDSLLAGRTLPSHEVPHFAHSFFYAFMGVQFLAVLLLTPASAGTAIAEEKERRTLEFILTTDLTDREIILSKLGARLANLLLFLLTGLPVVALVQLLGGVDPNLVLAGYAMTAATTVSLASLSICNSAYASRVRGAVFYTYLEAVGYLLLSGFCFAPVAILGGTWNPFYWLSAGNLFVALLRYQDGPMPGSDLVEIVIGYVLFHAAVSVACCIKAWRSLRRWVWEPPPRPAPIGALSLPTQMAASVAVQIPGYPHRHYRLGKPRPPIGDNAMLWKELHAEPGLGMDPVVRALGTAPLVLWVITLWYVIVGFCCFSLTPYHQELDGFRETVNMITRLVGTALLCFMLVGIALRAAGSLSGERERQTLDSLLTTPLSDRTILFAKWLASICCVTRLLWPLVPIWIFAVLVGGLHPLALMLLVLAYGVYAAFIANLGLWFSLVSRSTMRATFWTLLTLFGLSVAPTCLWALLEVLARLAGLGEDWDWFFDRKVGYSWPPMTLFLLAFDLKDLANRGLTTSEFLWELLIGVGCYAAAGGLLWQLLRVRFTAVTGRLATR